MNKRGQASIEFLNTYAWALLGLIVSLAALSLLGVFDINSYQQETCESGSQIVCDDYYYSVDEDGESLLLLKLKNTYDTEIVIGNIYVEEFGQYSKKKIRVLPGRTMTASFYSPETFNEPSAKETLDFTINYSRYGSENSYTIDGHVTVTATNNDVTIEGESSEAFLRGEEYCGDGTLQEYLGEECDPPTSTDGGSGSDQYSDSCNSLNSCLSDCTCSGTCGDGIKSGGEQCETTSDCNPSTQVCTGCVCEDLPDDETPTGGPHIFI